MGSAVAVPATLTHTEVFDRVCASVTESMGTDFELKETTGIIEDCGAESLDFLDILFRIEKEFGLSADSRTEFFPEGILGDRRLITKEGIVRPEGARRLREQGTWMVQVLGDEVREGACARDWYTIGILCRYVEWKLGMAHAT